VRVSLWLYYYAVLVAFCALVVIGSGAFLTSSQKEPASAEQPAAAGQIQATVPAGMSVHPVVAAVAGILTLGLVVWLLLVSKHAWLRWLSWIALGVFTLDAWTGLGNSLPGMIVHACLAPVFFSALVAICLLLSPGWMKGPEAVNARGWARLRSLAIAAPPLVLLQIALGAAYRHKVTSVMPHMANAMVVSLLTLIVCTVILQQYPEHGSLRSAAIAVLSIVLLQVTLGVTAFIIELLDLGKGPFLVLSTVSHVLVGSLTLASTLVLAMQAQRSIAGAAGASGAGL
jgi:heme A synthase